MKVYYNEFDAKTAAWLRQLIADGLIPAGDVDERSICDVQADDVRGYDQCHFFAGIGGWAYALQLAGWGDRPVWTGSCPCQPFSHAGKRKGHADERHLWPSWFRLIRECRPERVFGEQVESAVGHGWLDGVFADLEAEGYACGAVVLGAHSVGAPHIRQRLWWVADAERERAGAGVAAEQGHARQRRHRPAIDGATGRLPNPASRGRGERGDEAQQGGCGHADGGGAGGLGIPVGERLESHAGQEHDRREPGRLGADAAGSVAEAGCNGRLPNPSGNMGDGGMHQPQRGAERRASDWWADAEWIACADGKARRIKPGLAPLDDGIQARVVRLRGYGNAIVPQVAAEFIRAYIESTEAACL